MSKQYTKEEMLVAYRYSKILEMLRGYGHYTATD